MIDNDIPPWAMFITIIIGLAILCYVICPGGLMR